MKKLLCVLALLGCMGCEARATFNRDDAKAPALTPTDVNSVDVMPPRLQEELARPRTRTVDATLWLTSERCYFHFDLPSGYTVSVDLQMSVCEREFSDLKK